MNRSLTCLVLLSLLVCGRVEALPVNDLYTAEVLVPTGDNTALSVNAQAALLQVLVRVSGATDVGQNPTIADALKNPADYYYQYGYESTDRTLPQGDHQVPARILRVAFEPSAIARLLRQAGYPVWGSNRPAVLVWIAVSDPDDRRVLTDSDKGQVLQEIEDEARLRGLPLLFPLLDLEDTSTVSTAEVWGLFLDRIDAASGRYNPDVVLAARVQEDSVGQWTGSWSYRVDSKWQGAEDSSPTSSGLVDEMVDKLADELAHRYAVGSSRSNISLRVEGIRSLKDYADITGYLQSLTPVVDLSVIDVKGSEALFSLSTEGQAQQLKEIIDLDQNMVLVSPGDENHPVQYRWVGK